MAILINDVETYPSCQSADNRTAYITLAIIPHQSRIQPCTLQQFCKVSEECKVW